MQMCDASAGFPFLCCDVAAAAVALVEERVMVYGIDWGFALEVGGVVKRISALREVGNSLRRMRVSSK